MRITIQKASSDLVNYLGGEVSKIQNPLVRFSTMFAIGAMGSNPTAIAEKAKMLGIVDESGLIDTELVRSGFTTAFSNGNCLEALGMRFTQADGDELLRRLEM